MTQNFVNIFFFRGFVAKIANFENNVGICSPDFNENRISLVKIETKKINIIGNRKGLA